MDEMKRLLQSWKEIIDTYPRLEFQAAKTLFLEIQKERDCEIKAQKRQQLICSTLYVVCAFLEKTDFSFLNHPSYDLNDIINSSFEVWIQFLDTGVPFQKNSFRVFKEPFYTTLMEKMQISVRKIHYEFKGVNSVTFSGLFLLYWRLRRHKEQVTVDDFLEEMEKRNLSFKKALSPNEVSYELTIFECIYQSLKNKNGPMSKVTWFKLRYLKYFFIVNGLRYYEQPLDNVVLLDFAERCVEKINQEEIFELIFQSSFLKEREKFILYEYFIEDKLCSEIGEDLSLSGERVGRILGDIMDLLKTNYDLKIRNPFLPYSRKKEKTFRI